jgi:hypothetical protein
MPDGTIIATPLGIRVQIDLISVFAGVHQEFEVPMILEQHGLIGECDAEALCDRLLRSDVDAEHCAQQCKQLIAGTPVFRVNPEPIAPCIIGCARHGERDPGKISSVS